MTEPRRHQEPDVGRERDEVFLDLTRSICPVCKKTVDAEVNARDNQVYLRKQCSEHGEFEARVYGDAQMYVESQRFNKPGTRPLQTQTEVKDDCPADCGLCPEHKQHACLGIIEVNPGCNLDCPYSKTPHGRPTPPGSRSSTLAPPSSTPTGRAPRATWWRCCAPRPDATPTTAA